MSADHPPLNLGVPQRSRRKPMPKTKALLAQWDASTNPVLLSAAGQLRLALRADGRSDVAERTPPTDHAAAPTSERGA